MLNVEAFISNNLQTFQSENVKEINFILIKFYIFISNLSPHCAGNRKLLCLIAKGNLWEELRLKQRTIK